MPRIFPLIIISLTISAGVYAQQDATYASYMFNGLVINPAYAGTSSSMSASFLERFQNIGLKGAPETKTFSIHSPLAQSRAGVGLLIIDDRAGIYSQTGINGDYAYRIPINENSTLSLGIQAGAIWYRASYNDLTLLQNPDPAFTQNITEIRPNLGTGIYYYSKLGYAGLSMPHLIDITFNTTGVPIHQSMPVILTGGYVFTLNRMIKFKPNFLLQAVDGNLAEADANVNILLDEVIWFGISYKSTRSVALLTQLQITDQFCIGYTYQINTGPVRAIEIGSHELMANYRFKYNKRGVITPRYF